MICQNLISSTNKYNLTSKGKFYRDLIFNETHNFPESISLSKRIIALSKNDKCECKICGKIHGKINKLICDNIDCKNTLFLNNLAIKEENEILDEIEKSKINNIGIEYEDYVECKICGYRHNYSLSGHLNKRHKIKKSSEYKEKFNVRTISVKNAGWGSGDKNPAYKHGGKLSPWSNKFINPNNINIEECRKKARKKVKENGNQNTSITRWLNKGFSEEEAKIELSKRQSTFSLEKCIEKYGEEKGLEVFNKRQEKWQKTLNSKSQEEIDEINRSKASKVNYRSLWNNELNSSGLFYIIKLPNNFIKIGITSRENVYRRYKKEELENCEILFIKNSTINECFMLERLLLKEFKNNRILKTEQFGQFGWTETFKIDSDKIIKSIKLKENIEKEFNETFRKNRT